MVDEKKTEKDKYELVEVTTQTDTVIKSLDMKEGEFFTDKGILIEILNKLDRIEKRIG
jgi:hypothetical protein